MVRILAIASAIVAFAATCVQATTQHSRAHLRFEAAAATTRSVELAERHLQARNETLVCPSGGDRLAQESSPVLTTFCPVQCAADNLCIYYPANMTSSCTTTTGRQCVQGSACAFECVANPKSELGWFLSLYTEDEIINEVNHWNNERPADAEYTGLAIAINASVVRKLVGSFNTSVLNDFMFITGNEAANNINKNNYYGSDTKSFPRGEIVPFEVPSTVFESLQTFQHIKLENVRFNGPPSNISLKFPFLFDVFLRNAGLTSVPFPNATCPRLISLDLSMNQISDMTGLENFATLKTINLSTNAITSIPKNVISSAVISLAVDSNPLTNIPIGTLPPTLTQLAISDNQLVEVPGDIANMSALTHLFMSHNDLKTIPDNSLPFEAMYYVAIENCSLTAIPKAFTRMERLKGLIMDNNDFSDSPDFSMLPSAIIQLTMRYCNLGNIGGGLDLARGLQYLDISGNPNVMSDLADIPEDLLYLIVSDNQLTRVPPIASKLTKLTALDLLDNPLEKIMPGELPPTLTQIWMRGAKIRSLDRNTLPSSLSTIDIQDSLVEEPPEDVRSMQKLEKLQIVGCRLRGFDVADKLPALKSIQLMSNRITQFSGSYPAAVLLDLRGNQIQSFDVSSAPSLEILHLANNSLSSMPKAIFDLPKLYILNLTDNPIRNFSPSAEQIDFLTKIPCVRMNQAMFTTDCAEADKVRVHDFTVCKSAASAEETISPASSSKTSVALVVGNVLLGLVLCLLAFVWWRRRQRHKQREKDLSDQTASLGEHLLDESIWTDADLLQHRLDASMVQAMRLIGSGVSGEVWLASYRSELVVVKKLKNTDVDHLRQFVAEIKLVLTLSHPRLVEIVGVVWTKESDLALVIEYMAGGDLRSYLDTTTKTHDSWTTQEMQIALEITEAVVYLHSLDPIVIHRDLKSRNVLLDAEGHAKITDFGISRLLTENETMTANVGTMRWIAPEVLAGKRYSESADIYSLGVILSEIDTHKLPFEGVLDETGTQMLSDSALASRLASGSLKCTLSVPCPAEIRSLVERCTSFDVAERPTGLQIAYELRTWLCKE